MKLGKKEAQPTSTDLKLAHYEVALPPVPKIFGYGTLFADWGMLGNDQYGDCVFAGAGHETMVWNTLRHGQGVKIEAENALSDYSAVTGFDPNNPATDNGTYTKDAMSYRRSTGIVDAAGQRHKISAYVALDPKDWEQLLSAAYIFGAVGIGFEFPNSAWDQFDNGEFWDDVGDEQIDGGHYVPVVGSRNSANRVTCVTWGRRQQMTRDFYEAYNDESWAMLSEEQLRDGTGIHGLDLDHLKADLAAL